ELDVGLRTRRNSSTANTNLTLPKRGGQILEPDVEDLDSDSTLPKRGGRILEPDVEDLDLNVPLDDEGNRPKEGPGKDQKASIEEEFAKLRAENERLKKDLLKMHQEASEQHQLSSQLKKEASEQQQLSSQLKQELNDLKNQEQQTKLKRIKVISELLISVSKAERQEARMKVRQDSLRLGRLGVLRAGTNISAKWEDGQALIDLNSRLKHLLEKKESVEREKKSLKKRQSEMPEEDFLIQDEIYETQLASIKRDKEDSLQKRDQYELEKGRMIREKKRISDEDDSRFNKYQILNQQYALLNLLGKGGFSEVYKAFDMVEFRYVACKLHGVNTQWSEEKKRSIFAMLLGNLIFRRPWCINILFRCGTGLKSTITHFAPFWNIAVGKILTQFLREHLYFRRAKQRFILFRYFKLLCT
ncbi:hypothetical protein MKW94_021987, partial [Papaver nudicaule]|nr:hypothetical protein [Papaver nudicaule]